MIITAAQMAKINAAFNQQYEANAVKHLELKYAGWATDQPAGAIAALVSEGVKKAALQDVRSCKDVTAFLEYEIVLGKDFWKSAEHDWTGDIFNIRNITGEEKMMRMLAEHPL